MRGVVGLLIGLIVGAGAMYLALRRPWAREVIVPTHDAGVIVEAPSDAGVPEKKKKKGNRRPRPPGTQGALPTIDGTFGPDGDDSEETEVAPAAKLSDADRRLEWRGEDVTPGPVKVDMASGGNARALDDSEINATISSQASGVRDCITSGATGTDLRATITVMMLVGGNGKVTKSRVQAPHYLFEKGLLNCVQRAAGRMKFPSTGAPTSVTLPITLG